MQVRCCAALLLLLPLMVMESHAEETLPPPGTWVRYTVELPTRLPPDKAYRPQTPPSPTIRPVETDEKKNPEEETEAVTPQPPPVPFDRFVFTIRILADRSGSASILVEMGEGTHTIRQRVDAKSIPLLSGVESTLLHIPTRTMDEVEVEGKTLQTQVLRWTHNGREVRVWQSDQVPFGIVRIETTAFRLTLTGFGEANATLQGRDETE